MKPPRARETRVKLASPWGFDTNSGSAVLSLISSGRLRFEPRALRDPRGDDAIDHPPPAFENLLLIGPGRSSQRCLVSGAASSSAAASSTPRPNAAPPRRFSVDVR